MRQGERGESTVLRRGREGERGRGVTRIPHYKKGKGGRVYHVVGKGRVHRCREKVEHCATGIEAASTEL